MDIRSTSTYPASSLSNFFPHHFVFGDVECHSMEGLLQSFKFEHIGFQRQMCQMSGKDAKARGHKANAVWRRSHKLWWAGQSYDRHGPDYQQLLDRAYFALGENHDFQKALVLTGHYNLTHRIGSIDPNHTILTQAEFCSRLQVLRTHFQRAHSASLVKF